MTDVPVIRNAKAKTATYPAAPGGGHELKDVRDAWHRFAVEE